MRRLSALPVLLLALACGGSPDTDLDRSVERVDSAGVELVLNRVPPAELPRHALPEEPVRELRTTEDDPALYQVADVLPRGDGSVVVVVSGAATVVDFGPDGRVRRTFGRQGSGPGELRRPSRVVPLPADSLAVYDPSPPRRLTVFPPDGGAVRTVDLSRHLPGRSWSSLHPVDGGLALVGEGGMIGSRPAPGMYRDTVPSLLVDAAGDTVVSFGSWPGLELGYGEGIFGALAFGGRLASSAWDGRLVLAWGEAPEVWELGRDGAPFRIVRWPDEDRRVSDEEARARLEAELAQVPAEQRDAMRDQLETIPHAPRHPALWDLVGSDAGELWVGDYPGPPRRGQRPPARDWMVLDADGEARRVVQTPEGFRLVTVREGRVWGVWVDDLGQETVRAYAVPAA